IALVSAHLVGVRRNAAGGAGAHCSCPTEATGPPIAIICPLLLIACASNKTRSRPAELALFRSVIPVSSVQIKARSPDELVELPTITPESLMASARLELPPGKIPSGFIPSLLVQRKARIPLGPWE